MTIEKRWPNRSGNILRTWTMPGRKVCRESSDACESTLTIDNVITQLNHNDVLTGRGNQSVENQGNIRYRLYVKMYQNQYRGTKRKANKAAIALKVTELVRQSGGRFLRKLTEDELKRLRIATRGDAWVFENEATVLVKVKQALRGKNHHLGPKSGDAETGASIGNDDQFIDEVPSASQEGQSLPRLALPPQDSQLQDQSTRILASAPQQLMASEELPRTATAQPRNSLAPSFHEDETSGLLRLFVPSILAAMAKAKPPSNAAKSTDLPLTIPGHTEASLRPEGRPQSPPQPQLEQAHLQAPHPSNRTDIESIIASLRARERPPRENTTLNEQGSSSAIMVSILEALLQHQPSSSPANTDISSPQTQVASLSPHFASNHQGNAVMAPNTFESSSAAPPESVNESGAPIDSHYLDLAATLLALSSDSSIPSESFASTTEPPPQQHNKISSPQDRALSAIELAPPGLLQSMLKQHQQQETAAATQRALQQQLQAAVLMILSSSSSSPSSAASAPGHRTSRSEISTRSQPYGLETTSEAASASALGQQQFHHQGFSAIDTGQQQDWTSMVLHEQRLQQHLQQQLHQELSIAKAEPTPTPLPDILNRLLLAFLAVKPGRE